MRGDDHYFLKNGSKIFFGKGLDVFLIRRSDLPVGLLEITPVLTFATSIGLCRDEANSGRIPDMANSIRTLEQRLMKRVAVFGNTGGGKSTLAKRLSGLTRLPLYPLDLIQYRPGGGLVPDEEFLKAHAALLRKKEWVIDGYGSVASAWERFAVADTLVYIDLPVLTHYWWVTKRLIKGLFISPEGWPEDSPIWISTVNSYKVVWRCHRRLTPRYRQLVAEMAASKRVHHLKSPAEMKAFLDAIKRESVSSQ
jgi:adenylate kinase family enzyme